MSRRSGSTKPFLNRLEKAAFAAVFLLSAACSGGDAFQPAPGASVTPDDLPALASAAVASFDLQERFAGAVEVFDDDRPVCRGQEVWTNCRMEGPGHPPGWQAVYTGEAGPDAQVLLSLMLGSDSLEAQDMLQALREELGRLSTGTLRTLTSEAFEAGEGFAAGPCDTAAQHHEDAGCAWHARSAPRVGDNTGALTSDVLPGVRLSAVLLTRGPVFARIEVMSGSGVQSERVADQLAAALDDQIKETLSR